MDTQHNHIFIDHTNAKNIPTAMLKREAVKGGVGYCPGVILVLSV